MAMQLESKGSYTKKSPTKPTPAPKPAPKKWDVGLSNLGKPKPPPAKKWDIGLSNLGKPPAKKWDIGLSNLGKPKANPDPHNWAGIAAALNAQKAASQKAAPAYNPDPHNWAGIRAALDAQASGGSSMSAQAPAAIQAPSTFTTPVQNEAPSAVTNTAVGSVGAPTGQTFQSMGRGGTFGMFDRMRNQRSPRSGLSVTPEMLRATAAARLGG
jgi:hypothetical protein